MNDINIYIDRYIVYFSTCSIFLQCIVFYIKKSSYMYVYISTLYCCILKQCWRCGMYRLKRSQLCYDEERNNNKMMNLLIISIIFQ